MSLGGDIMEEYYEEKVIPHYKKIIELQREYIQWLEGHEIYIFNPDRGIELKQKIKQLEDGNK